MYLLTEFIDSLNLETAGLLISRHLCIVLLFEFCRVTVSGAMLALFIVRC